MRAQLPLGQVDVIVQVNPYGATAELGVGGYSPGAHTVFLSLDPDHPAFEATWARELPPMLAHELHHCARWTGPGYGSSLLEALVSEGLAQQFEREFRNGQAPIYARALTDEQLEILGRRAQLEYDVSPHDHAAWFYGSADLGLPRWTGYTLGFELVGRHLASTGSTAADAWTWPADGFRGGI